MGLWVVILKESALSVESVREKKPENNDRGRTPERGNNKRKIESFSQQNNCKNQYDCFDLPCSVSMPYMPVTKMIDQQLKSFSVFLWLFFVLLCLNFWYRSSTILDNTAAKHHGQVLWLTTLHKRLLMFCVVNGVSQLCKCPPVCHRCVPNRCMFCSLCSVRNCVSDGSVGVWVGSLSFLKIAILFPRY